jgi:hypothetical protein
MNSQPGDDDELLLSSLKPMCRAQDQPIFRSDDVMLASVYAVVTTNASLQIHQTHYQKA